jgi:hypothetical protein
LLLLTSACNKTDFFLPCFLHSSHIHIAADLGALAPTCPRIATRAKLFPCLDFFQRARLLLFGRHVAVWIFVRFILANPSEGADAMGATST